MKTAECLFVIIAICCAGLAIYIYSVVAVNRMPLIEDVFVLFGVSMAFWLLAICCDAIDGAIDHFRQWRFERRWRRYQEGNHG